MSSLFIPHLDKSKLNQTIVFILVMKILTADMYSWNNYLNSSNIPVVSSGEMNWTIGTSLSSTSSYSNLYTPSEKDISK